MGCQADDDVEWHAFVVSVKLTEAEVGWKITTIFLAKIDVFLPIQISIFVSHKSEILNIIRDSPNIVGSMCITSYSNLYMYLLQTEHIALSNRLDYFLFNIFLYIYIWHSYMCNSDVRKHNEYHRSYLILMLDRELIG